MAWDHDHVIALDDQPRLIALADGRIVHRCDDIGPASRPCPSVGLEGPESPHVAVDSRRPRFALADAHRVVVISAQDP
jgi:hypothetical protein